MKCMMGRSSCKLDVSVGRILKDKNKLSRDRTDITSIASEICRHGAKYQNYYI